MSTTTWDLDPSGETAEGETFLATAEGTLVATLAPLWSDEEGVRVCVARSADLSDLSAAEALALADALRDAASVEPPRLSG